MKFALAFLPLLLTGCFQTSPGGIQGVWSLHTDFDDPAYTYSSDLQYTFNGNRVTRSLTQEVRAKGSSARQAIREVATGEFSADTSVSPARIDIASITIDETPSDVDFAVYGAIVGETGPRVELFFGESTALSFQPKGLFERTGSTLALKFGSAVDYPVSLDAPFVYTLQKEFRLFP